LLTKIHRRDIIKRFYVNVLTTPFCCALIVATLLGVVKLKSELPIFGKESDADLARTSYANRAQMSHILAALMPTNALIVRICMRTGLRVSDVLELKTAQLKPRQTVRERKTGKTRRVVWSAPLYEQMQSQAGRIWVFESRTDPHKHRTRQAVYKDIKHVAAMFQRSGTVSRSQCIGTHTARKYAAVEAYHKGGLPAAQKLLNHSDPAITLLYALADKEL
jgi:integrase